MDFGKNSQGNITYGKQPKELTFDGKRDNRIQEFVLRIFMGAEIKLLL